MGLPSQEAAYTTDCPSDVSRACDRLPRRNVRRLNDGIEVGFCPVYLPRKKLRPSSIKTPKPTNKGSTRRSGFKETTACDLRLESENPESDSRANARSLAD